MSHYDTVITLLDQVAGQKTNFKKATVKDMSKEHLTIIANMLNPYLQYGIRKFPADGLPTDATATDADILQLLEQLSDKQSGVSGSLAAELLEQTWKTCSYNQREAIKRTCLKDPKAGLGVTLMNSVHKKLIPCLKVSLADKYAPETFEGERLVSPKLDGMRTICRCDLVNDTVTWMSRQGHLITTMSHLDEFALKFAMILADLARETLTDELADFTVINLDGEGVAGSFNDTVSQLRKKDQKAADAQLAVFDFFTQQSCDAAKQLEPWTQLERHNLIMQTELAWRKHIKFSPRIKALAGKVVSTDAEVQAIYKSLRAKDVEGVIVKDVNAPYAFRRNKCWSKIKDQIDADGTIIGYEKGDENKQFADTLGAIIVKLESGVEVKVSSGLTMANRTDIWNNKDKYTGRVIELLGHELTPDGSIRHPRLSNFPHCLRDNPAFMGDKI